MGQDALDLEKMAERRKRSLGGDSLPMGLGDFFFDIQDPLHPDRDELADFLAGEDDDDDNDDDDDDDDDDSSDSNLDIPF